MEKELNKKVEQEWTPAMEIVLNEMLRHPRASKDVALKFKEAMQKKENLAKIKEAMIKSRNAALERCPKLKDNYVETGEERHWDCRFELSEVSTTIGVITIRFGAVIPCNRDFLGTQTEYCEMMKRRYEENSLVYCMSFAEEKCSEVASSISKQTFGQKKSRWTSTMKQYVGWGLLALCALVLLAKMLYGWIIIVAVVVALYLLKLANVAKVKSENETTFERERRGQLYQTACLCQSVVQYETIRRLVVWGDRLENELFVVEKHGKLGVIDERGNEILPCEYDFIDYSSHELQHQGTVSFIMVQQDGLLQPFQLKEKEFGPKSKHITY